MNQTGVYSVSFPQQARRKLSFSNPVIRSSPLTSQGPRRSSIFSGLSETHVNMGVSMAEYRLDSLSRNSHTQLAISSGWSFLNKRINASASRSKLLNVVIVSEEILCHFFAC